MSDQTPKETPAGARIFDHTCGTDRDDGECMACGQIDCPDSEPLHYHHDGCPCCHQHDGIVATLTARCEALEQQLKAENESACNWMVQCDQEQDLREAAESQCEALQTLVNTHMEALNQQRIFFDSRYEALEQEKALLDAAMKCYADEQAKNRAQCEALTAERDKAHGELDYLRNSYVPEEALLEMRARCQHLEQVLQNMANDAEGIRDTINLVLKEGK